MVARLQYLRFCLFEMDVNVFFVIRCLYSAVSLTLVKEHHFIRIINYYYYCYYYLLLLLLFSMMFHSSTGRNTSVFHLWFTVMFQNAASTKGDGKCG